MFPFEFLQNLFFKEKNIENDQEDIKNEHPFEILHSYSWLP